MTASDFRAALARLELTQRGFARVCGCNERTVRRWALGSQDVPGWVPLMLRLLELVPRGDWGVRVTPDLVG